LKENKKEKNERKKESKKENFVLPNKEYLKMYEEIKT
jgi:hypothetical protein